MLLLHLSTYSMTEPTAPPDVRQARSAHPQNSKSTKGLVTVWQREPAEDVTADSGVTPPTDCRILKAQIQRDADHLCGTTIQKESLEFSGGISMCQQRLQALLQRTMM